MSKLIICSNDEIREVNKGAKFEEAFENNFMTTIALDELTDSMFEGNDFILKKYFWYRTHPLDRVTFDNVTDEEYADMVKKLKRVTKDPENLKLETASLYYKRKVFALILQKDLGTYANIDASGYIDNPDYFEFYDWDDTLDYVENKYREEENKIPEYIPRTAVPEIYEIKTHIRTMDKPSKNLEIITRRQRMLNTDEKFTKQKNEFRNQLIGMCMMLVKNRLAMIFDVKSVYHTINDVIEYTDGLSTNCLQEQNNALRYQYNRLLEMANDAELKAWIKAGNNDFTLYANGDTLRLYIEEYHSLICLMNDTPYDYVAFDETFDELVEFMETFIANPIDDHLTEFICLPDISNYILGYVDKLNKEHALMSSDTDTVEEPQVMSE
jgi:hypothetical protein